MGEVTYVSRVKVERIKGPLRRAFIPKEPQPIFFSTHSEVSEHYGVRPGDVEEHSTTLDYVVAAAAG